MTGDFGKMLIIVGLLLVAVGLFFSFGGKLTFLGKLPGDIHIEKENFSFFFPLGSCLLISLVLSLILWVIKR